MVQPETLSHREFVQRMATRRYEVSSYGIGAWVNYEMTENDRDGRIWLVVVTDGTRFGKVEASVARLRGVDIPHQAIAAAVEYRSGNLPRERRFAELVERGHVVLREDELLREEAA